MKMEHVVQWHTDENGKQIQGKIQEILIDANSVVEAGVPIVLISLLDIGWCRFKSEMVFTLSSHTSHCVPRQSYD